jgi:hypothetical protein
MIATEDVVPKGGQIDAMWLRWRDLSRYPRSVDSREQQSDHHLGMRPLIGIRPCRPIR